MLRRVAGLLLMTSIFVNGQAVQPDAQLHLSSSEGQEPIHDITDITERVQEQLSPLKSVPFPGINPGMPSPPGSDPDESGTPVPRPSVENQDTIRSRGAGSDSSPPSPTIRKTINSEFPDEDKEDEDLSPVDRAQEQLEKIKKRKDEDEEDSPLDRVRKLMEVELPADEEDLLTPEEKAKEKIRKAEEMESARRVEKLLQAYSQAQGMFDEILQRYQAEVGFLAKRLGLLPDWLTVGGEQRTRYEFMSGQFRRGLRTDDQQLALRSRLFIAVHDIMDPLRLTMELQDSRTFLTFADSNVTANHINQLDFQQLHADLFFTDFLGTGLVSEFQWGRVNMDLGRGRWIARNNYRNTTNAYDGLYWHLGDPKGLQAHSFAVWPVDKELKTLDPFFGANSSFLWGTYVLLPPHPELPWLRTELSLHRHTSEEQFRDFTMLGYRFFKLGGVDKWEFELESDYQFGDINRRADFAHFHHGELGYTFDLPWTPQILLKFDFASPGFDIMYGRRSFELMPTGIFGAFQRTNMASPAYRILAKPTKNFYMFFQHRAVWMVDPATPWDGTGLSDPTGSSGNFIGNTFELRARWRVYENVWIQTGYTHFKFGNFARNAPQSPVDRDMNYAYFWTEFLF
jgi:hypothetical protein